MKIIFKIIFSIIIYSHSYACSCVGENSVETEYKISDVVLIGKVISVKKIKIWNDTTIVNWNYNSKVDTVTLEQFKFDEEIYGIHQLEYTIAVEKIFKGRKSLDTIKVWTGFGDGDCGFQFIIGKTYLIFAKDEYKVKYNIGKLGRSKKELKGVFNTNVCSRTGLVEYSQDDLKYLNKK
jgi:hypothetical protein